MYIKHSLYHQYQIYNERRENQRQRSERKLNSDIAALRELIKINKDAMQKLNEIEKTLAEIAIPTNEGGGEPSLLRQPCGDSDILREEFTG